jgi:hypothetical protein
MSNEAEHQAINKVEAKVLWHCLTQWKYISAKDTEIEKVALCVLCMEAQVLFT